VLELGTHGKIHYCNAQLRISISIDQLVPDFDSCCGALYSPPTFHHYALIATIYDLTLYERLYKLLYLLSNCFVLYRDLDPYRLRFVDDVDFPGLVTHTHTHALCDLSFI
jgi:hypothetical protein